LLTSVAFGTSISQFAWMAAIRRAGRRSVAITALLLTGGSVALFFSATLNGGLPMILAGLSYGISVGGLFFLLWTGIAHHAARSHDAYGATATMGAFAGSAKVGQSVAMIMVGLSLQRWGPGASAWEGPPLVAAMAGAVGTALVLLIGLALWDKHVLASTRQS
jgi:MFS family permease